MKTLKAFSLFNLKINKGKISFPVLRDSRIKRHKPRLASQTTITKNENKFIGLMLWEKTVIIRVKKSNNETVSKHRRRVSEDLELMVNLIIIKKIKKAARLKNQPIFEISVLRTNSHIITKIFQ